MSFINDLISTVVKLVGLVKAKKKVSDIVLELVTTLPRTILDAIQFNQIDNVAKLEDALAALDARTGSDFGALDVLRDLPADKEEELFDALKTIVDILGKNKLKVEGYHV